MTKQQRNTIEKEFFKYDPSHHEIKYCPKCGAQLMNDGAPFPLECPNCNAVFEAVYNTDLWAAVFDRTLIVCESKPYRGKKLDEVLKMLYIQRKRVYNICAALDICEDEFYKKKREIKEIALMEAKRLRLL